MVTRTIAVALAVALVALPACTEKVHSPEQVARDRTRCKKWSKLLFMPKSEPLSKCIVAMRKLAQQDAKKYACGNACIDKARKGQTMLRCLRGCKK
jgi:anti-sigma factor ChrR (cupin superfamily)